MGVPDARFLWVAVLFLASGCAQALTGFNQFAGFNGELSEDDLPVVLEDEVEIVEGETPAHVVIEKVVAYPEEGKKDVIVLRNIGGQTADMEGWVLADGENVEVYEFGTKGCEEYAKLAPAARLEIKPASKSNPCGFAFSVGFRDALSVFDADENLVARVSWDNSERGTAFRRSSDGSYDVVSESDNLLDTLQRMGHFRTFIKALKATGLDELLEAKRNPKYKGVDLSIFDPPAPPPVDPQFPSWFGFQFNRSALPPPPPPPPPPPVPKGVPSKGPYTLLAPTDEAFDQFRARITGPANRPIPEESLFKLPELKHIMLYHIIPGEWTSEYLKNNTAIFTAKGVEIVPFTDGAMGEGKIMLHDSCVDKPTPDPYDCGTQVEFNKCNDPFMVSPLGAQWQGGFCQRTCQRCSCDPSLGATCAEILDVDVMASNGVVHSVSRILLPPPVFEKEDAPAGTAKELAKGRKAVEDGSISGSRNSLRKIPSQGSTSNAGISG